MSIFNYLIHPIQTALDFIRFKKGTVTMNFTDTGDTVEIEHAADKEIFEYYETEYVINPECFKKDQCYYDSRYVEPISAIAVNKEVGVIKAGAEITTERFSALYNSKVLRQMMYVKEKDLLLLIGAGIFALILLNVFEIWYIIKLSSLMNEAFSMAQNAIANQIEVVQV